MAADLEAGGSRRRSSKTLKVPLVKDRAQQDLNDLFEMTTGMRSRILSNLKSMVKSSFLADPDMWPWVRPVVAAWVDHVWSDVEHEVERGLKKVALEWEAGVQEKPPRGGCGGLFFWYFRMRAFVLSHYLPHNRSFFGKFNDPVYVAIYLLTLVPVAGMRVAIFFVILLMLFVPGPPDEFQLINYILVFKGMQFISCGLMNLIFGSWSYFSCYSWHKDAVLECIEERGPGTGMFWHMLLDYLGNIALVWIAFFALPYSKNHASGEPVVGAQASQKSDANDDDDETCWCFFHGLQVRGGRLRSLVKYDMFSFGASLVALLLLTLFSCSIEDLIEDGVTENRQIKENVFWSVVLYALLSLPFLIFQIPLFHSLLTHSDTTGFDQRGACVPFALPPPEEQVDIAVEGQPAYNHWYYRVANTAATFLRVAAAGRVDRGGDVQDEYAWGDFTRGLWVKIRGKKGRAAGTGKGERDGDGDGERRRWRDTFRRKSKVALNSGSADQPNAPDANAGPQEEEEEDDEVPALLVAPSFLPLRVVGVDFPSDAVVVREGVLYFALDVKSEGSLDAAGAWEPYRVFRRYTDFAALAKALGKKSHSFPDAPFPRKYMSRNLDSKQIEARRGHLQRWLNRIVDDPLSQGDWSATVNKFLAEDDGGVVQHLHTGDSGVTTTTLGKGEKQEAGAPCSTISDDASSYRRDPCGDGDSVVSYPGGVGDSFAS